jgi:hypothetical protein
MNQIIWQRMTKNLRIKCTFHSTQRCLCLCYINTEIEPTKKNIIKHNSNYKNKLQVYHIKWDFYWVKYLKTKSNSVFYHNLKNKKYHSPATWKLIKEQWTLHIEERRSVSGEARSTTTVYGQKWINFYNIKSWEVISWCE